MSLFFRNDCILARLAVLEAPIHLESLDAQVDDQIYIQHRICKFQFSCKIHMESSKAFEEAMGWDMLVRVCQPDLHVSTSFGAFHLLP